MSPFQFLILHSSQENRLPSVDADGLAKIILATNIAETSITIHGLPVVVDVGLRKERQWDCLNTGPTAKQNVRQRAGGLLQVVFLWQGVPIVVWFQNMPEKEGLGLRGFNTQNGATIKGQGTAMRWLSSKRRSLSPEPLKTPNP